MKMTIYLPDDLAEMVKEHGDLNVSAVCQDALRRELTRREEIAKLEKGMQRVVVYVEDPYNADVAFAGRELYYSDRIPEITAYLTRHHRIAIYDADAQTLAQFDSFADLRDAEGWGNDDELVAAVAAKLGEDHVVELDI